MEIAQTKAELEHEVRNLRARLERVNKNLFDAQLRLAYLEGFIGPKDFALFEERYAEFLKRSKDGRPRC